MIGGTWTTIYQSDMAIVRYKVHEGSICLQTVPIGQPIATMQVMLGKDELDMMQASLAKEESG